MKTVDFAAAGMSTDVPRPLSGASVAVRNIFVPYPFVRDGKESSDSDSAGSNGVRGGMGMNTGAADSQDNASGEAGTALSVGVGAVQKVGNN